MLDGLDSGQRVAAEAGGGLVVARAGAGTGKTRMLTTRIAHLVVGLGEHPASVLATTFTRKAAAEMLERAVAVGGEALRDVQIRTIDSVAARILRRRWAEAGLPSRDFLIADEHESAAVLMEALAEVGLVQPGDEAATTREMARDMGRRIGRWKENGLSPADLDEHVRPRLGQADTDAARTFAVFDAGLRNRSMVEFSDLCRLAGNALEADPRVLAEEAEAVRWLLVDEAQDINKAQLRLLRMLSSHHCNVTLVGDDDQSLYSWRGSIPALMERAAEFFPSPAARGVVSADLVTNRRCTDDVLQVANSIVDYNPRPEPKVLSSGRSGTPVQVASFRDENAEAEWVASRIQDLLAQGTPPTEIAVLARVGSVLEAVARALLLRGVPHAVQSGSALWDRPEVRDVVGYLKLAVVPDLDVAFRRVVSRPVRGLGPKAADAVVAYCRAQDAPAHEALDALAAQGAFRSKDGVDGALSLARHLRELAAAASRGASSEDLVDYVIRDIGYGEWALSQPDASRNLRTSFDSLREIARLRPLLHDFLAELAIGGEGEERSTEGVHVGTLHGSKGLEWDHVFLVAFEEGVLPSRRALEEAGNAQPAPGGDRSSPYWTDTVGGLEEERRLAHVGLTRARHGAAVTMVSQRSRNGVPRPARPSRFVAEGGLEVPRPQYAAPVARPASPFGRPSASPSKAAPTKKRKMVW